MNPGLMNEFEKSYINSKTRQQQRGVVFTLTFTQYLEIVLKDDKKVDRMNASYQKWIDTGSKGHYHSGYVLSWINPDAFRRKIMNNRTAYWCNHKESVEICKMKLGEKHTEESKQKISKSLSSRNLSKIHRERIASAKVGNVQSEEEKLKRKATWLQKRLLKQIQNSALITASNLT